MRRLRPPPLKDFIELHPLSPLLIDHEQWLFDNVAKSIADGSIEMRNKSKRVILFNATLVIGLFALSSLACANVTIGAPQPAQSSATYSADQQVVARVTVRSQQ